MADVVKVYWDICAWLGLLNGEPDKKRELTIVYQHARNGRYELWTSTIAMVEARRFNDEKQVQKPLSPEKERVIHDLFHQSFVKCIPLAIDIADHARVLFRTTIGLNKWQDAVHLASALRWSCDIMHTYDDCDLIHLSNQFQCRNGENLPICFPDETTDGPLFAKKRA